MINGAPYKTILVGDNGSPDAEHAVEVAISLAHNLNAKLIVLGVIAPPSPESQAEGYGLEPVSQMRRKLEERLRRVVQDSQQFGTEVVIEIFEGKPDEVIEQRAEQDSADLIVVGRRDIAGVRHWLEGSTSENLVRSSRTSVLVVHDKHR